MANVGSLLRSIAAKLGIESQRVGDDPDHAKFKEAMDGRRPVTVEFLGMGFSPIICDCLEDGKVDCGSAPDVFKGPQFERDGKLYTLEEYATMLCNPK